MSSYPVSLFRLLIYFFVASVVLILSDAPQTAGRLKITFAYSAPPYGKAFLRVSVGLSTNERFLVSLYGFQGAALLPRCVSPRGDSPSILLLGKGFVKTFFEKTFWSEVAANNQRK